MTELDPRPGPFGIGRVGADEERRAMLHILQRARRQAFGAKLRSMLIGDPIAAQNVRASTQPLLDAINDDMRIPDNTDEDELYNGPVTNWGPNDT